MKYDILVVFGAAYNSIHYTPECMAQHNGLSGLVEDLHDRIEETLEALKPFEGQITEPFIFSISIPLGDFVAKTIEHQKRLPEVREMKGFLAAISVSNNLFHPELMGSVLHSLN